MPIFGERVIDLLLRFLVPVAVLREVAEYPAGVDTSVDGTGEDSSSDELHELALVTSIQQIDLQQRFSGSRGSD